MQAMDERAELEDQLQRYVYVSNVSLMSLCEQQRDLNGSMMCTPSACYVSVLRQICDMCIGEIDFRLDERVQINVWEREEMYSLG